MKTVLAFARTAGVTPKTLRHYERHRLLSPRRNAAGYRVYSDRERRRIHDIAALKALGLSLAQIRELVDGRAAPLEVIRAQRAALETKRQTIERAITVLEKVERAAARSGTGVLPALIAEAGWSLGEAKRDQAGAVPRAPDRAGASRITLAHETLRAIDSGADLEALRARWRTKIAQELAGNPRLAEELANVRASRRHWARGMKEWAASLYEMDGDSFERLARFMDDVAASMQDAQT